MQTDYTQVSLQIVVKEEKIVHRSRLQASPSFLHGVTGTAEISFTAGTRGGNRQLFYEEGEFRLLDLLAFPE